MLSVNISDIAVIIIKIIDAHRQVANTFEHYLKVKKKKLSRFFDGKCQKLAFQKYFSDEGINVLSQVSIIKQSISIEWLLNYSQRYDSNNKYIFCAINIQ